MQKEAKPVNYADDGAALSVIAAVVAGAAGRDLTKQEAARDALAGRTRRTPTPGVASFAHLD